MSKPQVRSAIKFDLFADAARKHKIETLGDPLQVIARHIDFAHLTQVIDELLPRGDAAKGGRPPYPTEVMVRILILKHLYNLSDEQMEYQLLDRMSYQRFCLLTDSANIPDRNTLWHYQQRLGVDGVAALFQAVDGQLLQRGYPSAQRSEMLKALGYREHIQCKAKAGQPLSECQKGRNKRIAKTRARVKHPFAQMRHMGGKFIRTIGQARATVAMTSGGDTTVKGAVVQAPQITANVGGNLNVESLQDTSKFDSKQQSIGGSISIGYGKMGGSFSASKSKVDSDFASVAEQSGFRAGDEGFNVNVANNTDLKGGGITSTQKAIDDNKNNFSTGGTLTTSDIQNQANYRASSVGVNIGTGASLDGKLAPQGTSAGFGKDSGNASSTTTAAISGIAGNNDARTGDQEKGIAKIFDTETTQKEINAQVTITREFSAQTGKSINDYVTNQRKVLQEQLKNANTLEDKALAEQAIKDVNMQERALNILVGALTGMAGTVVTKEALSTAAEQMRDLMIKDSSKFSGVVDKDGKPLFSNISGGSAGVNGDDKKIAGTRADLDALCGTNNSRCEFKYKSDASIDTSQPVRFIGEKNPDGSRQSYAEFLQTEDGKKMLSAPFGGLQGGDRTWLFGMPYPKNGWVDKLLETFAGPHDLIGGKILGLYDEHGNAKRGMSGAEATAYNAWSAAALAPAAPLAASQFFSADTWKIISILLKAGQ